MCLWETGVPVVCGVYDLRCFLGVVSCFWVFFGVIWGDFVVFWVLSCGVGLGLLGVVGFLC